MRNPQITARRVLLLGFGVTLLATTSLPPAYSISITGSKKPSSFDLPCADTLDADTASDASETPANNPDLAPMTLSAPQAAATTGATTTSPTSPEAEGTLNASVTTNSFVPKGPLEGDNNGLLAPTSVKGSKTGKIANLGKANLVDQAKSISITPLPLMDSDSDSERKLDEKSEIEREQLTGLWESTLTRSPKINYVIQKLMPNSNGSKTTTILMRTLSTAMMGGLGTVGFMVPGSGGYMIQSGGMSIMNQLLSVTEGSAAKKSRITEDQQLVLYNMITDTAADLVASYRDYKGKHKSLFRANADFEDLKNLAPEAKKDGAKVMEIDYTLKKQQRDIEEIGGQLSTFRLKLIDLAGPDAVAKLDNSIDEEFKRLHPELVPAVAAEQTKEQPAEAPNESEVANEKNDEAKLESSTTKVADKTNVHSTDVKNHFKLHPL
ncbi:MAG: hypothetical protein SGJ27_00265 [Candidatus Melainabacteria bacterium]|nr:hypothetical protein [Candidatus Melainabacteria bacterium]